MKEPIIVSVCCVTYNHVRYISQAIDSFLMQETDFPFEVIVHDDASTDGTSEIILEYAKKYPDIIKPVIQKENQWSKGKKITPLAIAHASGKYIALCEGDDYWTDPLKLQKQVTLLEQNVDFAGSFHLTQSIDMQGNKDRVYGEDIKMELSTEDLISIQSVFHTSSFVFRKELLDIPAWFSEIVSGDMALFAVLSAKGNLIGVPEVLSVYRKHPGGITETASLKNNFHQKRIELMNYLNRHFDFRYEKKIIEVIDFHSSCLRNVSVTEKRSNYWKIKNRLNKKLIELRRALR